MKFTKLEEPWSVIRDADYGQVVYMPYLTREHAKKMADLLNDIETERVIRFGGNRANGEGDFYYAEKTKYRDKS